MIFKIKSKYKIFCVGKNKTGTTSLEKALRELGYKMGDQSKGELLLKHYINRDFKPILEFCKTAEAFQDIPFSYPYTFLALHQAFPNAKFILSVRDDGRQWYHSLVKFHSKLFGKNGGIPTSDDLKNATYRYKGFIWDAMHTLYQTPDDDPYNEEILIAHYYYHNQMVRDFFRDSPNLLEVNLSAPDAYRKFCMFLNFEPKKASFPWENKTDLIKTK